MKYISVATLLIISLGGCVIGSSYSLNPVAPTVDNLKWLMLAKVGLRGRVVLETEVTVSQYAECVWGGRCPPPEAYVEGNLYQQQCNYNRANYQQHPINCLTFGQAQKFCQWVGGRLPTWTEWQKFAYGIDEPLTLWSEDRGLADIACINRNAEQGTCEVNTYDKIFAGRRFDSKQSGLYGVIGNVAEWTTTAAGNLSSECDKKSACIVAGGGYETRLNLSTKILMETMNPEDYSPGVGFRCIRDL